MPNETRTTLARWFKALLLCQTAELCTEVLDLFGILSGVAVWTSRIAAAVVIVTLAQMAETNPRYRKAAVFHAVALAGGVLVRLGLGVLALVLSVCSLVAMYHEFGAHEQLLAPLDETLAARWHSLFYWKLFGGLLAAVVGMVPALVLTLLGWQTDAVTTVVTACIAVVTLALEGLHALYLRQTLGRMRGVTALPEKRTAAFPEEADRKRWER